jgi:YesN/AraC family two-component response regulator
MHPNYLSGYIKKHTGKSFKEMIQIQRMQQAAELLKNSDLSTNDICLHVGYQNNSFFFRKFKEFYGCSPKEYREKNNSSNN